jgi:preprotein translocase subunit YajC
MGYIIVLIALFALMWLLLIRPQRRRTNDQLAMQDQLRAGDEIITAGGLHAKVRSIEDDVLEIELTPETIVRLDRRAVAAVVSEPETAAEPEMAHPEQQIPPGDG